MNLAMNRLMPLASVLASAALAVTVGAQQAVFRARVELVRLPVLVTDGRQPVAGLVASDFEIEDNGVPQDIEALFSEPRPLDVLLVVDRSGSLRGEPVAMLRTAAHQTVNALLPDDRCGLLTFSHTVELEAELTTDRSSLHRPLDLLQAAGLTSLLDALYSALALPFPADRRSLILLFSDGLDNTSWMTAHEVTARAQHSETIIAAVAYKPEWAPQGPNLEVAEPDLPFLKSIAGDTGGEVIEVRRPDQFAPAFSQLLERTRSRYLITYYPKGPEKPGWHEVKVKLRSRRGAITARRGFWLSGGPQGM